MSWQSSPSPFSLFSFATNSPLPETFHSSEIPSKYLVTMLHRSFAYPPTLSSRLRCPFSSICCESSFFTLTLEEKNAYSPSPRSSQTLFISLLIDFATHPPFLSSSFFSSPFRLPVRGPEFGLTPNSCRSPPRDQPLSALCWCFPPSLFRQVSDRTRMPLMPSPFHFSNDFCFLVSFWVPPKKQLIGSQFLAFSVEMGVGAFVFFALKFSSSNMCK